MAGGTAEVLTAEDIERFVTDGYVVVHGCFSPEAAAEVTATMWTRLGYDPDDPSTWERSSVHMPAHRRIDVSEFAPRAWAAMCQLVGGTDRIATDPRTAWGDSLIVNLWENADQPWAPPAPNAPGWHKDCDFFRHFLDSPEQGLLTLVLWTDVLPQGGATWVAADSLAPVARYLADHPEGVHPLRDSDDPVRFDYADLLQNCTRYVEGTGSAGDVYLIHPYLLHAKGQNNLRRPRAITNPPIGLTEPMRFDRADPADHSPVERAVLRALGVQSYPFTPTAPRADVVPPRVAEQERLRALEKERLAG